MLKRKSPGHLTGRFAVVIAVTPTGLEQHSKTAEKRGMVQQGGAESGAVSDGADSELARLVQAWPKLPSRMRAEILALMREAESV